MTCFDFPATPLSAVLFYLKKKQTIISASFSVIFSMNSPLYFTSWRLSNNKNYPLMLLETNFRQGENISAL